MARIRHWQQRRNGIGRFLLFHAKQLWVVNYSSPIAKFLFLFKTSNFRNGKKSKLCRLFKINLLLLPFLFAKFLILFLNISEDAMCFFSGVKKSKASASIHGNCHPTFCGENQIYLYINEVLIFQWICRNFTLEFAIK